MKQNNPYWIDNGRRSVFAYEDDKYLGYYATVTIAAKETGISTGNIVNYIKSGKPIKSPKLKKELTLKYSNNGKRKV